MLQGEKTWLCVGLVIGFATALIVSVMMYRTPVAQRVAIEQNTGPASALTAADTLQVVQLTPGDEEKIGLKIDTIRRNAVSTDVVTLGRVEEVGAAIHT